MWQDEYLENLNPLRGAVDMMGLSTQFLGVSLVPKDTVKWDQSYAASLIGSVPTMLEILEDTGFFLLLGQFCALLKGLQSTGLLLTSDEWKQQPSEGGGVLKKLDPFFRMLVHLSPWKIYHSFWSLRDFLEKVEDEDWEGQNCVKYLSVVQQGLEGLEPEKTLNCFEGLHDFLNYQQQSLAWLESHPEVHEKLGHLNFFPTLALLKKIMEVGMEYFNDCLIDLQEVLEDLNEVEAIVPSPDDLDMY
ncbi:uncharacterized protein LOC131199777 [Ahaetulla prasina]|uniref:uncharacterized protein LOC131199777 n=1 Tax=Ahaetulla prasina TaxID=499056 RepID=UPI002647AEF7|nr:uncharacterized protein LOC131199777 [Ahaetulla prasina]XP_058041913.1 uncharacterized protein LOC131199777 [Ahaetulla prasina]XP_058041915.1 uncharacterized protein LOC131199777 [Ahaetulla prasina]XP_058041916.1 uncharacterized protein LOC131199777 [Ahaetulla prasina]